MIPVANRDRRWLGAVSLVSKRKLTFALEAGQVRYVRLNISMGLFVGRVYGELVDEANGRSEIADTRYTGPAAVKP